MKILVTIEYCPIVVGRCSANEREIRVQPDTFFLAEPFKPDEERKRREDVIKIVLTRELKDKYCSKTLKVADEDPKEKAIFCDVCRMIQSSAYGIADISGLNPNVLLELGMMFALGKPVSVIFKKSEERNLKEQLPSDIVWKRVIPYEEFIDIHEGLGKHVKNRPIVTSEAFPATEMKKIISERDPQLAKQVENKLRQILKTTEAEFERLMEKVKLSGTLPEGKVEITPSLEARLDEISEKVKRIERFAGFPKDAKSSLLKGNWHFNKGEFEEALNLYDWALNLEPEYYEARFNKGAALSELGRYDEALKCYDEALRIKPDDFKAWSNKGAALNGLGRHDEAIKCCDEALRIKPDESKVWSNKGAALNGLGRHDEALKCYDEALRIEPGDHTTWSNKGNALNKLGRHDEAIKCCDEALRIKPDLYAAWNNKGNALSELGRYDEALKCYDEAKKITQRQKQKKKRKPRRRSRTK